MIRTVLCLLALLVWSARAGAEGEEGQPIDLRLGGELTLSPSLLDEQPRVWDRWGTGIQLNYGAVEGIAELSLVNDQKYTPYESYWLGRYWYLDNGGIGLDFGPLKLRGGRLTHRDIVDTPYSLFINSKDLPVMTADLTFEGGPFVYTSRWIRLTTRSQAGYPDRGANYKVFGPLV